MIYLTFNEQPSGVYFSQVTDVVKYINDTGLGRLQLFAFIAPTGFSANKKKIKQASPDAIVLPALPKGRYTGISTLILFLYCLFTGNRKFICRNVTACNMVLNLKSIGLKMQCVYDGRGAIAAEWNEYDVVPDPGQKKMIHDRERRAVRDAQFRIGVSSVLIKYWQDEYQYNDAKHVVIPCTITSEFKIGLPSPEAIEAARNKFGFANDEPVLIYSGSTAGWQSFHVLGEMLEFTLKTNNKIKLVFLSKEDPVIDALVAKFPGRISRQWLQPADVADMLLAGDYGILFREQSVTNKVAAPTKFAEYLAAGLPVLISENIGDYTSFVNAHQCGKVLRPGDLLTVTRPAYAEKLRMNALAEEHFTKPSQLSKYKTVTDFLQQN